MAISQLMKANISLYLLLMSGVHRGRVPVFSDIRLRRVKSQAVKFCDYIAKCSVSKKSNYKFRHAGRLLRNGAEFRILGGKMYEGTSTEQKAKNAKSGLDSMSKPLLQSLSQRNVLQPLFT